MTFFSTLSTLVDGGDYRLVCWGCLVTVIVGQLSITPRSTDGGGKGKGSPQHCEERGHLPGLVKR